MDIDHFSVLRSDRDNRGIWHTRSYNLVGKPASAHTLEWIGDHGFTNALPKNYMGI
jgi:hypothetical protein